MKPVKINIEKCSGCGLCVTVCPYEALAVDGGAAEYILQDCFLCGHCEAVCPEGAIEVAALCQPSGRFFNSGGANDEAVPAPATVLSEIMRKRRSCRSYLQKEVPLAVMEDLVQLGITAPSGTNCQPWQFILLPARDDVSSFGVHVGNFFRRLNRLAESRLLRLFTTVFMGGSLERYYQNHYESVKGALHDWDEKGVDRLFHGATGAILVLAEKDASCPGEDAMLATANILLGAESIGLGTCLIGFAVEAVRRDRHLRDLLKIPQNQELYAVIALGYPKMKYLREAGRKVVIPRIVHLTIE